jgi:leader peptidase (prepilin peptidase)/N-methyltransferase
MTTPTRPPHDRTCTPTDTHDDWSVARAFTASTRGARLAALVVSAALVVATTTSSGVPWATGVTLVALLPAALVDLIDRRLPNRLVGGAAAIGSTIALATLLLDAHVSFVGAGLGALTMATPLLVAHLVSPASMGFGDVKLAVVIGAALGLVSPSLAFMALAIGSLLAAIHGISTRQRTIAFGPALLVAAAIVVCVHAIDTSPVSDAPAAHSVESDS